MRNNCPKLEFVATEKVNKCKQMSFIDSHVFLHNFDNIYIIMFYQAITFKIAFYTIFTLRRRQQSRSVINGSFALRQPMFESTSVIF